MQDADEAGVVLRHPVDDAHQPHVRDDALPGLDAQAAPPVDNERVIGAVGRAVDDLGGQEGVPLEVTIIRETIHLQGRIVLMARQPGRELGDARPLLGVDLAQVHVIGDPPGEALEGAGADRPGLGGDLPLGAVEIDDQVDAKEVQPDESEEAAVVVKDAEDLLH